MVVKEGGFWTPPTPEELNNLLDKISAKEAVRLLGVDRITFYRWRKSERIISKANFMMIKLYVEGFVDINCEAVSGRF